MLFPTASINSSHSSAVFVFSVILLYFLSKDVEVVAGLRYTRVRMKRGKMYFLISPIGNQSVSA